MSKKDGFGFGIIGGSRKHAFEKDSGIRISFVTDGTFVLRSSIKGEKSIEENFKSSEELCSMVKNILDKNIDKVKEDIVIHREEISREEYLKRRAEFNARRSLMQERRR